MSIADVEKLIISGGDSEYDEIMVPNTPDFRGGCILVGTPDPEDFDPPLSRTVLLMIKNGYGREGPKHLWLQPDQARALAIALLNGAREAEQSESEDGHD